jgi:hypothetical protein
MGEARRNGVGLRELGRLFPERLPAPLTPRDVAALDFEAAVERRRIDGGTARGAVQAQLEQARSRLRGAGR